MASEAPETNNLTFARAVYSWRLWWRESVIGTVDQQAVIERRRAECTMSARYMFMTAMSGGIAILGLLLSSPAVVIGAMLLSPLMDPIIGLGFALATGDYKWLRQSAVSLAWGTLMAVGLCALIVFLSPIQTVTSEIAARTSPNLFDLLVALFSALAGAYAMIRGRENTIVGVAIATALMPPLAVIGFGLATWNWTVFSGALLLYVTNLLTIALTAWGMARLYGFRSSLSERQSQFQNFMVVAVFVALSIPLAFSLRQIAWEANSERQVRSVLIDTFDDVSRLDEVNINWDTRPITIDATVMTPTNRENAEAQAARVLTRQLGQDVDLRINQYLVGTGSAAAEQAQLSAARASQEAAAAERVADLTSRLAIVAGVKEDELLIDRERRRAVVKARELDGATMAAYADLENRIGATAPDWRIELIPPAKALPVIAFVDSEPADAGAAAIGLIAWAGRRVGAPIILTGPVADAETAAALLRAEGLENVTVEAGRGPNIIASWGDIAR
ncbi:DUF389 domain-containing protein [Pontixanthobacter sp.]|uniref:DUF389 domain-containing protein n=1 Tax=Pontixanthobacter sp. TaxID=2792078 RepID=UPI003C7BA919